MRINGFQPGVKIPRFQGRKSQGNGFETPHPVVNISVEQALDAYPAFSLPSADLLTPLERIQRWEQSRYVPVNNDPPERPVGVKGSQLVVLPEDYKPSGLPKQCKFPPLEIPQQEAIETLKPGETLVFSVPPADPETFLVKPNPLAKMDLKNDEQARRLVAGGNQASIIGKNWKAIWGKEKVCRDLLQNFFDGHKTENGCGTLEGTLIKVTRDEQSGKFKIRLEGLGQFDYEKAYLLGGTSKAHDKTAAGNYGEGLKVLSLNLLRDFGANAVNISSANWKMTYTLPEPLPGREAKLFRHLIELKEPIAGNYIEFETEQSDLVAQLFKSLNYFYHPYNPDFQDITCQNSVGGFKIMASDQGNVYLAKQRFAYEQEDNWERPLKGLSIWTHEKVDKGRDRNAVSQNELYEILNRIIQEMSNEDLVYTLKKLEPHWKDADSNSYTRTFGGSAVRAILQCMRDRKLAIPFNEKYYAGSTEAISYDVKKVLTDFGYEFMPYDFRRIGMTPLEDWHLYFMNFKIMESTENEKYRMTLLKETMSCLLQQLEKRGITQLINATDLAKHIYLYDREACESPDGLTEGMARFGAIWFGKDVLALPLPVALNFYMHELMHKHGPDNSDAFSRVYDQYLPALMTILNESPEFLAQMQQLETLWQASVEKDQAEYHGKFYKAEGEKQGVNLYA